MAKYRADVAGLGRWEQDVKTRSIRVVRDALLQLNTSIIENAPVRTGFMVASSHVRLNSNASVPAGIKRPPGFREPEAQENKLEEVKAALRQMTLKDVFSLRFRAEYTRLVHEGTDKMAARPFIAQASWQWANFLRRAVAKYKRS